MSGPAFTVARVARESSRRLIAFLAARSGDVAAAEDALADAFEAALAAWPVSGVPRQPEAWLLTAARRRLIDAHRQGQVREAATPTLRLLAEEGVEQGGDAGCFPDERLKLMFVCAHPAIDPVARTPLMLQTVLGLDAAMIAGAYLIKPAAMGQRLSRVKAKIRDAGIPFELPAPAQLPERLDAVLQAIYAAFGLAWADVVGADPGRQELSSAAVELASLLHSLLPSEPEVMGLLALMLHCQARSTARRDQGGRYRTLAEQDPRDWSRETIYRADRLLAEAARANQIGRFQLEAAIQSCHSRRVWAGDTDWSAVVSLYEGLCGLTTALGARVAWAAAKAQRDGLEAGLAALDELQQDSIDAYQPYWALRAHLLAEIGDRSRASEAYRRAIALAQDDAVRAFLNRGLVRLGAAGSEMALRSVG